MKNFKKPFLVFLLLLVNVMLFAQRPTTGERPKQGGNASGNPMMARLGNIGRVYGKIVDATTKKPVEFASVVVVRSMGGGRDTILGGGLTLENGDFSVATLPLGPLKIKVSFVGYLDYAKNIMLTPPENVDVDLGDLMLKTDSKVLDAVQVTAEKAQMVMNLDKKVFNVEKNITSSGGTAEDVLKNIPSVTVDADGAAKLRNNATTVYVDGRPTLMSLNQIPSDQIESVEVITNPSAKFEASTTGGILNIILKKNRKPGYNGFIGLGIGTGKRYNTTVNLNVKEGRFNVSGFYNLMSSMNPTNGYVFRENLSNQRIFNQNTSTIFNNSFQIGKLGVDYSINNRNTLTVSGNIVKGKFNINSDQTYTYPFNVSDSILNNGERIVMPRNNFTNYQFQTTWKRTYPKKGKELVADATYGWGSSSNVAEWTTTGFNKAGIALKNTPELVNITGGNEGQQFTAQLDYTNPLNDSTKLEMGLRSNMNIRNQQTFFKNYNYITKTYIQDNSISQNANITDMVNAAYINYSSIFKSIGYQVGLRYEQSQLDGKSKLVDVPSFGYKYSDLSKSLFPSVYLSKKLDKTSEIQLNYSRKIQRPNFMQLMPVIQNNDRENRRIGNPKLEPEFVNLGELNFNKQFKGHNWLISAYYMLETNTIKPYSYYDHLPLGDSILTSSFANFNSEVRYGLDNTLKLALSKSIDFTTSFNVYQFIINIDETNSVKTLAWDGKTNLNIKLPKSFSIQLNGNYESDRLITQGKRKGVAFMDFAVKKSFFSGAANLTFAVNDVFDSRRDVTVLNFPTFSQETKRRRDLRNFRLSFQMPFGKMDASIFKKGKDAKRGQGGEQPDYGGN